MPYQPIENYGLIGNMRTTALVGMNGSIDWLCFPHFDSPSIFAAILDDGKGGQFSIDPIPNHVRSKQYYWPDTNVLVTRFHSADGVGRVIDFMPVGKDANDCTQHGVVRRIQSIRGTMTFRMECRPAFNYGPRHPYHFTNRTGRNISISESLTPLGCHSPTSTKSGCAHCRIHFGRRRRGRCVFARHGI